MNIGIEAQRLFRKKKHGMDIVAAELICALQKLDTENNYFIFVKKNRHKGIIRETPNFKIIEIPHAPYPIWEQILLPLFIRKYKLDFIHFTANTAPLFLSIPFLVTLHDVIFMETFNFVKGSLYQRLGNLYRWFIVPRVIRKANFVGTVSNTEKNIAIDRFPFLSDKIQTYYNAVGSFYQSNGMEPNYGKNDKYNINEPYILALGSSDPRKNTKNIVKAFLTISEEFPDLKLVITDLERSVIYKMMRKERKKDSLKNIITLGYVPNNQLPYLYRNARLFMFPSIRESFGIPVLEAMACGTPLITSNITSMPEIVDDAAIKVNPFDVNEISEAMRVLLTNNSFRKELILKGTERVQFFSYELTAKKWIECYKSLYCEKYKKSTEKLSIKTL